MKKGTKKLHSEKGSTLLMALFLMFVAIMVSAVVLSTALSSAATVKNDKDAQQTYLTVSSAVDLMRDGIEKYPYREKDKEEEPIGDVEVWRTKEDGTKELLELHDSKKTDKGNKLNEWSYSTESITTQLSSKSFGGIIRLALVSDLLDLTKDPDPVEGGNFTQLLDETIAECVAQYEADPENGNYNSKRFVEIEMGELEPVKVDFELTFVPSEVPDPEDEEEEEEEEEKELPVGTYSFHAVFALKEPNTNGHDCIMYLDSRVDISEDRTPKEYTRYGGEYYFAELNIPPATGNLNAQFNSAKIISPEYRCTVTQQWKVVSSVTADSTINIGRGTGRNVTEDSTT